MKNWDKFGLAVSEDNVEVGLASEIFSEFDRLEFETLTQERYGHYGHVFRSNSESMPSPTETYAACITKAKDNQGCKIFNRLFEDEILPKLKKVNPDLRYYLRPNITRVQLGTYYRAHNDAYAGEVGFNIFFSKGWKWDYGGILTFVDREESINLFPGNGKIVFRDERRRPAHFVSPVTPWAKEQHYYLIVGWASEEKGETSEVRGAYYEF